MKISKEARKKSRSMFRNSFVDGKLDAATVKSVVAAVAESKPRHYMGVLKNYQRLIRLEVEKHHAVVESAEPLDSKVTTQIKKTLRAKYGKDLTAEFNVVPELIGGLRIKLGSTVWDSSVRDRLDRLQTQLASI